MKTLNKFKFLLVALISLSSFGMANAQCQASYTYTDNGAGNFSFTNTSVGNFLSYSWTFGDGNSSNTNNAQHQFTTNGNYAVCLTIFDSINQCTDTYCDSIWVTGSGTPCNITASFNFIDNGGGNYSFNNNSTGSGTDSYWYFGDGGSSNSTSPSHTFAANGIYTIQLYIADPLDSNCYDYVVQTINVSGVSNPVPCQAGFVIFPDSSVSGNVIVINSSTGNNLTYFWDFGDGNTSTLAYPNYTYSTNGPFQICLTVSNGNGCTSTYCDSINSGGIVLKQSGFTINIQAPALTDIKNEIDLISELNTYPNPVKNNLTIELNLTENTQIEIVATDLIGNIVAKIINESMTIGINTIQWNVNNLPNGVYLLNIKSNNSIKTKKLVINK